MSNVPTLKDVAAKMGLSEAAVSLGLRHAGNISEATCKRIEKVALEMGYRPNPHAAALGTRVRPGDAKGVPLAILQRSLKAGAGLYPIQSIVDGIVERSSQLGYRIECFPVRNSTEFPRLLRTLRSRGFLGIFVPPIGDDFRARDFDWSQFSVVGCGRYDQSSLFHTVRQEIFESTRFLLDEMIRNGYRRICLGLLKHDLPLLDDYARVAVAKISVPPRGKPTEVFFSDPDEGLSSFVDWVRAKKADAVVGFSLGHYYALVDAGIKIPRDMGFASLHQYDDTDKLQISALRTLDKHIGIVAANRMDTMIRHHERGIPTVAEQITIRSDFFPGTTMPALKTPR
ncbi:MAG: LacI family DNA-binding transcriptional regulator [Verrucomicrobia bacterium]|nr:LacI family DNA-binding transcriptional regulator [Verrucomicrobiota bacterium]